MDIDYKITEYFDNKNLFDCDKSKDLLLKIDSKTLLVKGNSRDLVELADVLVSVAKNKENTHVHLDDLTLINNNSDIKEIVIEKVNSNE